MVLCLYDGINSYVAHIQTMRWQFVMPHFQAKCQRHTVPLHWRNKERGDVSNHRRLDYLFNGLFRCRSKETSKVRVTGLCGGIHRWPVNSLHKGPVTRKMFSFGDAIMLLKFLLHLPRDSVITWPIRFICGTNTTHGKRGVLQYLQVKRSKIKATRSFEVYAMSAP